MEVVSSKDSSVASSPFSSPNISALLKIKIVSWYDYLVLVFILVSYLILQLFPLMLTEIVVAGAKRLVCLFLYEFELATELSTCTRYE